MPSMKLFYNSHLIRLSKQSKTISEIEKTSEQGKRRKIFSSEIEFIIPQKFWKYMKHLQSPKIIQSKFVHEIEFHRSKDWTTNSPKWLGSKQSVYYSTSSLTWH